jgi:hypothetical protein
MAKPPQVGDELIKEITRIFSTDDFFGVLGIQREASADDVSKAYRRLAIKLHPDKCKLQGKGKRFGLEAFKKVGQAYACLRNEQSRKLYEHSGSVEGKELGLEEVFQQFSAIFKASVQTRLARTSPAQPRPSKPIQSQVMSRDQTTRTLVSVADKLISARQGGDKQEEWDAAVDSVTTQEKLALLQMFDAAVEVDQRKLKTTTRLQLENCHIKEGQYVEIWDKTKACWLSGQVLAVYAKQTAAQLASVFFCNIRLSDGKMPKVCRDQPVDKVRALPILHVGDIVEALYGAIVGMQEWLPARVAKVNPQHTYSVVFDDGTIDPAAHRLHIRCAKVKEEEDLGFHRKKEGT